MKPEGVTTQMKVLHEYIVMLILLILTLVEIYFMSFFKDGEYVSVIQVFLTHSFVFVT